MNGHEKEKVGLERLKANLPIGMGKTTAAKVTEFYAKINVHISKSYKVFHHEVL